MPKYALPEGASRSGSRRFSHFAPVVSSQSTDNLGGSMSAKEDGGNSSEEDGTLAKRLFRRSFRGSVGSAPGGVFANLVQISPIFYEQLFRMKVFCAALMCLHFGFVIFWRKDFGTKAAHKVLVKLTPGENIFSSLPLCQNKLARLLLVSFVSILRTLDRIYNDSFSL
jgi:hypothetical protein